MGIYSNGNIFGIKIYTNDNDNINIIFEKKYDIIMRDEQKKEAYLFYKELSNKENTMNLSECNVDKELLSGELCSKDNTLFSGANAIENTLFQIYSECFSTYDKGLFMLWYPISIDSFIEIFDL
jgi:hypothetical protein